jgi:hypothetical protein
MLILKTFYSDLYHCQPTSRSNDEPRGFSSPDEVLHYIELTMRVDTIGYESIRRPLVRCDSETVAKWVGGYPLQGYSMVIFCPLWICTTGFELLSNEKILVIDSEHVYCSWNL